MACDPAGRRPVALSAEIPADCYAPNRVQRLAQRTAGGWTPLPVTQEGRRLSTPVTQASTYGVVYQDLTAVQATGTSISSNGLTVSALSSARMTLLATEHGAHWVGVFADTEPPQLRVEGLTAGKRWWWHFAGKLAEGNLVADGTALELVAPVGGVVT